MVAHQYFETASQPPPLPPPRAGEGNKSSNPSKRSFRRGLLVAVAAVALASGAGSGAAAATLIDHGTQTRSAGTGSPTTSTSTSSTATASLTTAGTVYKQDSPGVVTITVSLRGGQAIGSGIVLDTKGDILTNAHVIAGAQRIEVTLSDRTTTSATVVGSNSGADLAVIRVSVAASSLHPLTLGNSGSVQVGDTVYAIGSPFGLSGSLTEGIVSNLGQTGAVSNSNNLPSRPTPRSTLGTPVGHSSTRRAR